MSRASQMIRQQQTTNDETVHFVRHSAADDWIMLGWLPLPDLDGTHHGDWSVLMKWCCECKPPIPRRPNV